MVTIINAGYVFLLLHKNVCCGPSLEPSRRDGCNKGHNMCYMEY